MVARFLKSLARSGVALAVVWLGGLSSAAAVEVRVGFIPVAGVAQLFVIEGEGWAKQAGLEIKTVQFESGPAMISALASGTLDAYFGGIGPIMVASARGIGIKVMAATAIEEMTVVARGPLAGLAEAATAAGFKAFAEANGRPVKLATQPSGSVPDTVLRYWLANTVKADPAHYQIVPMGIEQTQQALLAGAVDAASIREPTLTLVRERDAGVKLLALGGDMMPGQPGSVLAITDAFVARNRDAAASLVALTARATDLLESDVKRAAVHVQRGLGKGLMPVALYEKALTSPASKFVADPGRIRQATAVMQAFQIKLGVLEKPADLDVMFDDSFYRAARNVRP